VASGAATPRFADGHALGCAMYDAASRTVYAFGTTADSSGGGGAVDVFWSADGMRTWQQARAVDFAAVKKKVFNTSVGKGKLKGKVVWLMAYETSVAGTPGAWNTQFAVADSPRGPWTLLDDSHSMARDVEHADPTIRWLEEDGMWYAVTARRDPGGSWFFFTEVSRSADLTSWESPPGMGSATDVGQPLLRPNPAADQAVAPTDGAAPLSPAMDFFLRKLRYFWSLAADVNTSDLDLCEFNGSTIMYFNWGEQHYDNALALAVADMPMAQFLRGFFPTAS
jgi:hypothetical protein